MRKRYEGKRIEERKRRKGGNRRKDKNIMP